MQLGKKQHQSAWRIRQHPLQKKVSFINGLHYFVRPKENAEAGYGLLLALLFVSFLAGTLTIAADNDRYRIEESKAEAAALELVEIARAARIYVRNNADPLAVGDINGDGAADNAFDPAIIGAAPAAITIANLQGAGLIPLGYDTVNIYGQTYTIIANTWPLNDPTGIATAFIHLNPGPRPSQSRMQSVATAAAQYDVSFNAPFYGQAGLQGPLCAGAAPFVRWGAGVADCMNAADVAAIGGGIAAAEGALVVPAWISSLHDLRAIMRYPQPNNPQAQTMATDLFFGSPDPGGAVESIYTPNGTGGIITTATTLPAVLSDDSGAIDQNDPTTSDLRTNIIGVSQIDVRELIIAPQTPGGTEVDYDPARAQIVTGANDAANTVFDPLAGGDDQLLSVTGPVAIDGGLHATGRLPAPGGRTRINILSDAGGAGGNLNVDNNVTLNDPALDMTITGNAAANNLLIGQVGTFSGPVNLDSGASFAASANVNMGDATIDNTLGNAGVIISNINTVNYTTDMLDVLNTLQSDASVTISGDVGGGYAVAAGQVRANNLAATTITANNGIISNGTSNLGTTEFNACGSTNGNCPDIQEPPRPCQIFGTCP